LSIVSENFTPSIQAAVPAGHPQNNRPVSAVLLYCFRHGNNVGIFYGGSRGYFVADPSFRPALRSIRPCLKARPHLPPFGPPLPPLQRTQSRAPPLRPRLNHSNHKKPKMARIYENEAAHSVKNLCSSVQSVVNRESPLHSRGPAEITLKNVSFFAIF
jgi:hypothetical protein